MTTWPASNIETRALDALIPYAKNARTHSAEQIEQLVNSIREWGWTNPVLIDEGDVIIAGHGRVLAARQLGLAQVPVVVARGWSEVQKKAYVLADNQLALNAGWDLAVLKSELQELREWDFDPGLLGFADIDALLADRTEGLTDPDDVPAKPANPVSRPGDLWTLGRHRLLCGDATDAKAVKTLLAGVEPHLMVTDPPYGVNYDPTWRKGSEGRSYMAAATDREAVWKDAWALFPGDVVYIWHAHSKTKDLWIALEELGFELRQPLVWNKMRFVIGRGNYSFNHEACFYGIRKKGNAHWQGARNQPTVWDIPHKASDTNHGAQKPVECMKRPIENNSSPGQAVYDPFLGSGTTVIAAEMTGRICLGLEIDPAYCDVIVKRWEDFTGNKAAREIREAA